MDSGSSTTSTFICRWFQMEYVPDEDFAELPTLYMIEIVYPESPTDYDNGLGVFPFDDIPLMSSNVQFHHVSADKTLSAIVCQRITAGAENVILRDEFDNDFECHIRWARRRCNEGYLTRGWHNFCNARELKGGCILRFSVNESENIFVVHVKVISNL
ncbi:DNA-binding barrel domain superfamily [Sesbania bispinosa]|nr:DNA-binding barrel domain superfamily [Sesbania bispinosa]